MKYFVMFLILFGFCGLAFGQYLGDLPSGTSYDKEAGWIFPSPLKQFKSGILIDAIQCNDNLVLLQKYNGFTACVKPETKQKLIERHWITTNGKEDNSDSLPTFDFEIKTDTTTHGSQYQISGGIVENITHDEKSNSLEFSLSESEKGYLQIVVPSGLLHKHSAAPFVYAVTVDGKISKFEKFTPILLKIPFEKNTQHVEITGITQILNSLDIVNEERDAMLAAGYKLYPGVGWVAPDEQNIINPIYREDPNNPGKQVLDLDAMLKILNQTSTDSANSSKSEYLKARAIYGQVREAMDLPFTGITTAVNDKNTILLGIDSDKLSEEKDKEYYQNLVDVLFKGVTADIEIVYKSAAGHVTIQPEIGKTGKYVLDDKFEIKYSIDGAYLEKITRDSNATMVEIVLDDNYGGTLDITIPRDLIDARIGESDDDFFVLIDGIAIQYSEEVNEAERKLTIKFESDAKTIQIIGTNPDF